MDDDIDIEEHDVLDNPLIKNMFPDIAVIKTEVDDYSAEETSVDIQDDYYSHSSIPIVFEEDNNFKTFNNKIILGSKPSTSSFQIKQTFSPEPEFHGKAYDETVFNEQEDTQTSFLKTLLEEGGFPNKIILGSKTQSPDSGEDEEDEGYDEEKLALPKVSVVLEDCKNFLENNPCFCKECEILFPTDNDLDAHKMMAHSYLVAVSKNRALKSTSKYPYANNVNYKNLTCSHCDVVFPNTIALLRHSYELLPGKFPCEECDLVFENDAACKMHKAQHGAELAMSIGSYIVCKICTCHFKSIKRFHMHTKSFHRTNGIDIVKHEPSNLKCRLCNAHCNTNKSYNTHIVHFHSELYHRNCDSLESISKFKCPQCNLCFSSHYSVRIHLAAKHGNLGTFEDSKRITTTEGHGQSKNPSATPTSSRNSKMFPLSKSTLFKCNKCLVHFVSCSSAVLHSRSCVLKKGDFQCHQCKLTFNSQDKSLHYHQHSLSDKLKVIEISTNILNRVLCECETCNVFFDEKSFHAFHTNECNGETPAIHCTECNNWIHAKVMPVHKKIHLNGLASRDFILIDYVHIKLSTNELDTSDSDDKLKINTAKLVKKETKPVYKVKPSKLVSLVSGYNKKVDITKHYYCPTCKCFMKMNRLSDRHFIGKCNTGLAAVTCKTCGLRFTVKGLLSHNKMHKKYPKLRLKDFKFTNIQSNKKINPPFPIFKKCKLCNVTFFSAVALKRHACHEEEPKVCGYCDKKFSDLAYNLHVQFHEYPMKTKVNENIPELIKKYESLEQVWNILFLCQTCDIIIDSYDRVVEHCQDHFCNMESYNVTIKHCDICDLNFVSNCFQKHKDLHMSDDFNKDSFKILEYKYENLLTDSWLDIFATLTKEQIDLILSKSMYMCTRSVRMKTVTDGPSNMTLYQCGECKVIVAPISITEHSQKANDKCKNSNRFPCSMCELVFAYKSHKLAHENLHEFRELNDNSFRIIQFHADKQFSFSELKQNEAGHFNGNGRKQNKEDLKFIRCQHCGKLINKQKYKNHIMHHNYYDKIKSKLKVARKAKTTAKKSPNIVHNFYKCKNCKLCVMRKTIKGHNCENNYCRKKCSKCLLWFRSQNLASHYKYHENYNFNRSNMNIIYFEKGVIINKSLKKYDFVNSQKFNSKVLTYYQCSQCTMCLWNKANINRHVCPTNPLSNRITCKICGINYQSSRKVAHSQMHATRNFNSNNIKLIQFKDKKIIQTRTTKAVAQKRKSPPSYEETVPKKAKIIKPTIKAHNKDDTGCEKVNKRSARLNNKMKKEVKTHNETKQITLELHTKQSRTSIHNRFYKCKTCKLLFVNGAELVEHEDVCFKNRFATKCGRCGLVFHASQIELHKKSQKCLTDMGNIVCLLTIKQKGKSYKFANNWIYLCSKCGVHNISYDGFYYHVNVNHKIKYAAKSCQKCNNIQFMSSSFQFHQNIHHGVTETAISDLSIAEVEDTTLEKALNDLPDDKHVVYVDDWEKYKDVVVSGNDDSDSAGITTKRNKRETNATRKDKKINVTGIYNCDVCGLNFVHPTSLNVHKLTNKHNEVRYGCKECGLSFTSVSLKKHMSMHHSKAKVKNGDENSKTAINDSIVESVPKIPDDEQPNNSSQDTSIIIDDNISITSNPSNKLVRNLSNQTNTSLVSPIANAVYGKTSTNVSNTLEGDKLSGTSNPEQNIETASRNNVVIKNIPSRNVENIPDAVPNEANTSLNKNKLFRCGICDVYFLTSNDCYDHTISHTQLDTTEYIACKICDLQFCCEFLGRHMKSHREQTFCIDDLIVVEYRPSGDGELKTHTYLAMDRIKTKVVSTTTHFDTEDEKSVCVDSTTTENVA